MALNELRDLAKYSLRRTVSLRQLSFLFAWLVSLICALLNYRSVFERSLSCRGELTCAWIQLCIGRSSSADKSGRTEVSWLHSRLARYCQLTNKWRTLRWVVSSSLLMSVRLSVCRAECCNDCSRQQDWTERVTGRPRRHARQTVRRRLTTTLPCVAVSLMPVSLHYYTNAITTAFHVFITPASSRVCL